MEDDELRPLLDFLQGRNANVPRPFARGLQFFCLRNNIIYKRNFAPCGRDYLLVVPACFQSEVLRACHDDPAAGHLGYARTTSRIKQNYYWPNLAATVKQYIRTCRECQRRKTPPGRPAGLLQPVQVPKRPFEQIGMDFLGPFPTSHAGNKWIIVATDYLTRYAETKALQRCTLRGPVFY